ncbi:MAG TPA: thioredoxin domain-containing protein [Solirubrobacteraceae bacterium]|nr:thioredoxin domain-containing protein [Solirubrobacteraceae bacterium]
MANALARETSPYLRQHAENPVDWLPWGPEALARAQERSVPVLVSIGYSACHWCHVMERESFEDEDTARQMNEGFVCVKVDREERPDVDALYMEAVQGMTGHGGWPLNVFLTPDGVPFYGGTYFPPQPRPGMPSFRQVLLAVGEAWDERGDEIAAGGERMRERLVGGAALKPSGEGFDEGALQTAVQTLRSSFDALNGGFGEAPKFPQTSVIEFLLCRGEREMALYTLRSMAGGGIHDQIGGGFHRYAVDATWTVPHFEKMLYDNALLARAYLHGAQLADDAELLEVSVRTLDWMLREMRGPEGGFYSALDADSEGVEGRYYVWSASELERVLGDDAEAATRWLGVSEQGNFVDPHHPEPGLNVLEDRGPRPDAATRERIRAVLLRARAQRTRPGLDDKRLTSWNALAISALAEAGAHYLDAAVKCAEFVLRDLRDADGRLLRTYGNGEAKIGAYLEDHAFLLEALIALFEATCEERWLAHATSLADETVARFGDPENGGFFSTAADGEALIARRKELEDSPIPAGGSSAALGLLRLAQLTGEERYERASAGTIELLSQIAPRHPGAFGHMLQAMHWSLAPMRPIACALPTRPG